MTPNRPKQVDYARSAETKRTTLAQDELSQAGTGEGAAVVKVYCGTMPGLVPGTLEPWTAVSVNHASDYQLFASGVICEANPYPPFDSLDAAAAESADRRAFCRRILRPLPFMAQLKAKGRIRWEAAPDGDSDRQPA